MPSIRRRSKPARSIVFPFALLIAFAATMAVPAVGLAEPAEEPQPPQLAFDPGSYDFGLVEVDRGGQANLQLRNEGAGEVHVDSVEIAGPGQEAFGLGYNNCGGQTLQPNQTCSVGVSFNPHASTGYSARLRANTGGYQFSAELSGSGGRAEVGVEPNPTNFGVAKVGSTGVTREIAVTNSGTLPAGFFIAVISGGAVGSFQLLDENCTGHLLAPSASCTLQARFRPLSEGVKTATLSLFGDQDGGAQIGLTGVGAAPEPAPGSSPPSTGVAPLPARFAHRRAKVRRGRPSRHRRTRRAFVADARRLLFDRPAQSTQAK